MGRSRSISAHAEEPRSGRMTLNASWVYLRARGGTRAVPRRACTIRGLSPRTRRNPRRRDLLAGRHRSISAHAEEPAPARVVQAPSRGLSPRMRRNQRCAIAIGQTVRSISAHAEEPARLCTASASRRVYLRACGGTERRARRGPQETGLSPRMRRNRTQGSTRASGNGSISAHAEEPGKARSCRSIRAVYLRARGGTRADRWAVRMDRGLSPRTRRNPLHRRPGESNPRSISAHAEEPRARTASSCASRVYLRARGGTRSTRSQLHLAKGLSPRTRRNRRKRARGRLRPGSISAHAEEPD